MIYKGSEIPLGINKMNSYGAHGVPFLFMFNYSLTELIVYALDEVPEDIKIDFGQHKINNNEELCSSEIFDIQAEPVDQFIFDKAFTIAINEINYGNSFLLNLTFPSKITMNYSLEEVFYSSEAKYKVLWKDRFVSFSPECFIKIKNNKVFSYPMKGTIDANIKNAEKIILDNPKEEAEHYTIVDLIRNDIAQISTNVEVTKFRYLDTIKTNKQSLLQVSSEIVGELENNWKSQLGDYLYRLLPAGSISGAPKTKTLEIINKSEIDDRGFYTGVCGIFDGDSLDSCVMIRFIEKRYNKNNRPEFYFRSGGGITYQSKAKEEYNELIQKIYVPIY